MAERPIVLLVLGMHRSGTSALARVLNLLGARLPGDVLGGNRSNPRGHWEPRRVIAINEALLAGLGRRWDDPRELPGGWCEGAAADAARAAIAGFAATELAAAPLSVVKDPRLCLLAPLWLEVLAERGLDTRVIVPLRDPVAVVASLQRRDGMAVASAARLWQRHLVAAEAASRARPRVRVRYAELLADWRAAVAMIADTLQLAWPDDLATAAPAIEAFLQPPTPTVPVGPLPDPLMAWAAGVDAAAPEDAWQAIAAAPARAEAADDLLALAVDDLAARESHAARIAGRGEAQAQELAALRPQVAALGTALRTSEERLASVRAELERSEQARQAQAGELTAQAARLQQQQVELATQATERARQDATLAAQAEELDGQQRRLAALARKLAEFDRLLAAQTGRSESLARALAQVEEECRIMLHSRSWRLTAPLRAINARLRSRDGRGLRTVPVAGAAPAVTTDDAAFDPAYYLAEYPDVRAAGLDPWQHYLHHGRAEGRLPRRPPRIALAEAESWRPDLPTVLVVGHDASRTGAPVLTLNLIVGLRRTFNVVCMPLRGGGLMPALRHHATVTLDPDAYGGQAARMVAALDALTGAQRPRFALVNSIEARAVLPLLAARGIATVSLIHEFPAYTRPRHAFPDALWWATRTVFSTPLTRDAVLAAFPECADAPLAVLPQGRCRITAEPLAAEAADAEAAWLGERLRPEGWRGDTVLAIGIGSVQQRKGVDLFVQCAAQVRSMPGGERCRFAWIGHGYDPEHDLGYSAYLDDQVRRSGLEGRLVFIGPTAGIDTAYRLADVLLLPSRLDPLPNVAIDAMAHGLPVLCFAQATGIAAELEAAGVGDACVSPYLDSAAMAGQLLALARAPAARRTLGERLRAYVAGRFAMDAYVARLLELGEQAQRQMAREAQAVQAIVADAGLRMDFFRREPLRGQPLAEIVRCEYVRPWAAAVARRKPLPGLHPGVYAEQNALRADDGDSYAHWLGAGRPDGPWRLPVLEPAAAPGPLPTPLRVALHVHAYYPDLLPAIVRALGVNRLRPDLFVSIASAEDEARVRKALQAYPGRLAKLACVPNRGRDIGPLLTAFAADLGAGYDLIGHVHTKKTADLADAAVGERWFRFLLENLLGGRAPMLDAVLAAMATDPLLGLVFADDPNVVGWGDNRAQAQALAERLRLGALPHHFNFPVGTMFWARPEALRPWFDLGLDWCDYPPEPLPYDGTVLHAIERLLPFVAVATGLRCAVTCVPGVTR